MSNIRSRKVFGDRWIANPDIVAKNAVIVVLHNVVREYKPRHRSARCEDDHPCVYCRVVIDDSIAVAAKEKKYLAVAVGRHLPDTQKQIVLNEKSLRKL